MTTELEKLEAQSRAAIKAWCDDPSVQLEWTDKERYNWEPKLTQTFYLGECYYRIAKPKKWYRVGRDKYDTLFIVQNEAEEQQYESIPLFKCWLPEGRKYYE